MSPDKEPFARAPRILCVDDEPAVREMLAAFLSRENYSVETAADGAEAWSKVANDIGKFDVIVTDGQMPKMDGLSFIRRLRAAGFPGRIVVFSSRPYPHVMEQLLAERVDAVVEKGACVAELREAVKRAVASDSGKA